MTGVPLPGLTVPLLKGCVRAIGHVTADLTPGFVTDNNTMPVLAKDKWNWAFYVGNY